MREAETTAATPATTFAPPSTGHGDDYLLGWSEQEVTRLIWQGELFRPFTRRLLEEAGLKPGMRVLDLGSGAGDVAMLAAELVGPEAIRVWRLYMVGGSLSFRDGRMGDDQILMRMPVST